MKSKSSKSSSGHTIYILLPFIVPICLIILGILMLADESLVNQVIMVVGILIAVLGFIEVVIFFSRSKYEVQPRFLINGIIYLVIGAVLIIAPLLVNTIIPVLMGICVLALGISGASNTLSLRKEDANITAPMVVAIIQCLLGIFILVYVLFINPSTGWDVIGVLLIISGVLRIFNEILARISVPKRTPDVTEQPAESETIDTTAENKGNTEE